jgi:hypothetical protein
LVAGIATVLADDGVAVIETPYVVRLVEDARFDTVYHEHVFYYSLTAICVLAQRHGLAVGDVEEVADQGGSLRVLLHHAGRTAPSVAVSELLDHEARLRIAEPTFYDGFAARVDEIRRVTVAALTKWRRDGASIAGYGAAAKGTVLLNHFGIDGGLIDYVVDLSEHKQGLLMPGVGIPICHPRRLVEAAPDYVLLLVWNLAAEVVEQQAEYRRAGGQFVIPRVPLVVT